MDKPPEWMNIKLKPTGRIIGEDKPEPEPTPVSKPLIQLPSKPPSTVPYAQRFLRPTETKASVPSRQYVAVPSKAISIGQQAAMAPLPQPIIPTTQRSPKVIPHPPVSSAVSKAQLVSPASELQTKAEKTAQEIEDKRLERVQKEEEKRLAKDRKEAEKSSKKVDIEAKKIKKQADRAERKRLGTSTRRERIEDWVLYQTKAHPYIALAILIISFLFIVAAISVGVAKVAGAFKEDESAFGVTNGHPTGACCYDDKPCKSGLTAVECTGVTWLEDGDCTACNGACCYNDGNCGSKAFKDACEGSGGTWWGVGTKCGPNDEPCPQPDPPAKGACCVDGECQPDQMVYSDCSNIGGDWYENVECTTDLCAEEPLLRGACCYGNGLCQPGLTEEQCGNDPYNGTWKGDGSICSSCPAPSNPTGACCFRDKPCQPGLTSTQCTSQGGLSQPWQANTDCNICPPLGTCCIGGYPSQTLQNYCAGDWNSDPNYTCPILQTNHMIEDFHFPTTGFVYGGGTDKCLELQQYCWEQCGKPETFHFKCSEGAGSNILSGKYTGYVSSCTIPDGCLCRIPENLRINPTQSEIDINILAEYPDPNNPYCSVRNCGTSPSFSKNGSQSNGFCPSCSDNCGGYRNDCINDSDFCQKLGNTYCSSYNMCKPWRCINCSQFGGTKECVSIPGETCNWT